MDYDGIDIDRYFERRREAVRDQTRRWMQVAVLANSAAVILVAFAVIVLTMR